MAFWILRNLNTVSVLLDGESGGRGPGAIFAPGPLFLPPQFKTVTGKPVLRSPESRGRRRGIRRCGLLSSLSRLNPMNSVILLQYITLSITFRSPSVPFLLV